MSNLSPVNGIDPSVMGQVIAAVCAVAIGTASLPALPDTKAPSVAARAGSTDDRGAEKVRAKGNGGSGAAEAQTIAATSGSQDAPTTGGSESSDDVVKNAAGELTDPNGDVKSPEDVQITSVAFAPRSDGQVVYAIGQGECGARCNFVLFRSDDGGASWNRLSGGNLLSDTILMPPNPRSEKIFAMGGGGLQMSDDGGENFEFAIPTGATFATGDAAISPAFGAGDPTVLIGAQTLMKYRDDLRSLEPVPMSATGPFHPAFSPSYPTDPRQVIGAIAPDVDTAQAMPAVYTCIRSVCDAALLEGFADPPQIRLPQAFALTGQAYAFTQKAIFSSRDGATSFRKTSPNWGQGVISDVAIGRGSLFAALYSVDSAPDESGLFVKTRDGWSKIDDPLFDNGVMKVIATGDRVIAALRGGGIACSRNSGRTWSDRCAK